MIPDAKHKFGRDHTGKPFGSRAEYKRYLNQPGIVGGERPRTLAESLRARNLERDQEALRVANLYQHTHCAIHGLRLRLKIFASGAKDYRYCARCGAARLKKKPFRMLKPKPRGLRWESPLR